MIRAGKPPRPTLKQVYKSCLWDNQVTLGLQSATNLLRSFVNIYPRFGLGLQAAAT